MWTFQQYLVPLRIATINRENLISTLMVRIMVSCKGHLTTFLSSLSLSLNNYMIMGKLDNFYDNLWENNVKVPSITLGILYRHSISVKVKGLTNIKQLSLHELCTKYIFDPPIWHVELSLAAQLVKNAPAMQKTLVRLLGWEDPLKKG